MEQTVTDDYVAPDLPEDLIRSILVHLPVKSLMRFRSVCKDWKNLFKTESFIAEHLHHSTAKQGYLISDCCTAGCDLRLMNPADDDMKVVEFLKPPFIDVPVTSGRFVYSSNGLLCVRFFESESIFLWNPAIRESRLVLRTVNRYQEEYYRIGFGFSPILNDHKIVRIFFWWYDSLVHRVEMFSLSTGSWDEVDDFGKLKNVADITNHSITCNGAIFWFCIKNYEEGSDSDGQGGFILSFDIATEVFDLLEMPASAYRSSRYDKLTVYENKLALLSERACRKLNSSSIDLWVMEGLSWTRLYTTSVPFPRSLPPIANREDKIISGVTTYDSGTDNDDDDDDDDDDDEDYYDSVVDEKGKMILANFMTNEFKMSAMSICCFDMDDWVFNHVESLVPVSDNSD